MTTMNATATNRERKMPSRRRRCHRPRSSPMSSSSSPPSSTTMPRVISSNNSDGVHSRAIRRATYLCLPHWNGMVVARSIVDPAAFSHPRREERRRRLSDHMSRYDAVGLWEANVRTSSSSSPRCNASSSSTFLPRQYERTAHSSTYKSASLRD